MKTMITQTNPRLMRLMIQMRMVARRREKMGRGAEIKHMRSRQKTWIERYLISHTLTEFVLNKKTKRTKQLN